jgi:hypothetical protein
MTDRELAIQAFQTDLTALLGTYVRWADAETLYNSYKKE